MASAGVRCSEILLLGVHYDPVMGSPGANDNASGIAALLEISHLFQVVAPVLSIRFVAFVNEEPPFFRTAQQKRSMVYAQAVRRRGDDIRLMASLETIGSWKFSWDGFGLSLKGCSPATGCGLSGELQLFAANRIDLSVRPRGIMERPPLILAPRLPRRNDHRHGTISLSALSCSHGHARQARLPGADADHAGIICCVQRDSS